MRKTIWLIIIAAIIVLGYLLRRSITVSPPLPEEAAETPTAPIEPTVEAPTPPPVSQPPPPAPPQPAVREINMDAGYFFFQPSNLTLKKGEPVRLIISNSGTHTFTIDELGVNAMLRDSRTVVEFTPNKTGVFTYYCAVPGHRQNGQVGTLTVAD